MLSPELYKTIFDNANDLIIILDTKGKIVDINNSAVKIFGIPKEELVGKKVFEFVDSSQWKVLKERADLIFKNKKLIENSEIYRANFNGREYYLEARGGPIIQDGKVTGIISILRDVTERIRNEQELERIKEELENLFNNAPYGIAYFDKNLRIIRLNATAEKIVGYSTGEIKGKFCYDVVGQYKDSKEKKGRERICDWCTAVDALELGKPIAMEREYRGRWLRNISVPVRNSRGEIIGGMEIITDITREKELIDKLKTSEEKYRSLFENALDAIFIVDSEARIIEANNITAERLGYTREELIGKTVYDITPESIWEIIPKRIDYILKEGSLVFESFNVRKDGSFFPVEITTQRINFGGKVCILNISRDISERKKNGKST